MLRISTMILFNEDCARDIVQFFDNRVLLSPTRNDLRHGRLLSLWEDGPLAASS